MGFLKAFHFSEISGISLSISKTEGFFWLLASLIFIGSEILFLVKISWWPFVAMAGILLSQILIIINWSDAKFGTILNIFLLILIIPAIGKFGFDSNTEAEIKQMELQKSISEEEVISENHLTDLPPIVQTWMKWSGASENKKINTVHLFQNGKMRTKPEGKWMPFIAEEFFNVNKPSFLWKTRVKMFPGIYLSGRDKLKDGKGAMLIKVMDFFPVVNEKDNEKINSGTMIRFLGEICWFPTAAFSNSISWQEIDKNSAKAIFRQDGKEVSGIFHFSSEGELLTFEAECYYSSGPEAKKEKWLVETIQSDYFGEFRIPSRSKVSWILPNGDFHWLSLNITGIEYR
ncbi:hypothetical protein C7S20_14335 [Christiangramia fulva]|uniref:Uncharacterized protein n=2 Tax=Christiangramia fulva TaxID=2126553 RepID=A0A2R3Z7Z4_9FLAO|nr:hypothetical protein C7S20_14335 [Christiangramia fulva]